MKVILRFVGTVLAVAVTISIVSGVSVTGGWMTVFLVAIVWSVISLTVKPVLQILTLPITIVTFGLFALILNALLFWMMAAIVPGFVVDGFLPAFLGALVLSFISWMIHLLL